MRYFLLISLFIIAASCNSNEFSINGKIFGTSEGSAVLVTNDINVGQIDTIASAEIFNYQFQIKGSIDDPMVAILFLTTKDMEAQFPIFLENNDYSLEIDINNTIQSFIHGTDNQELLNRFISLVDDAKMKEINELFLSYEKAQDREDVKSMISIENELKKIGLTINQKKDSLIKINESSPVSAFIIMEDIQNYSDSTLVQLYKNLQEPALSSLYGRRIYSHIQLVKGMTAPDFSLPTPEKSSFKMSDLKTKAKILYFWSSESVPCHVFNNQMVKLYKEYHKDGLDILGISLDVDYENWKYTIEQDTLTWNQVVDTNHFVEDLYCISTIPHIMILDENNVITAKNIYGDALKQEIETLLHK